MTTTKAVAYGLALVVILLVLGLMFGQGYTAYIADANSGFAAPTNVRAAAGPAAGTAIVSWNAVTGAPFYRIGWVSADDVAAVQAEGRHWLDAFVFSDVASRGQTSYTVERLAPGQRHAFIVTSLNTRFGAATWSEEWAYLTTPSAGAVAPAPAPTPAPTATATPPAPAATATPPATPAPSPTPTGNNDELAARYAATGDYDSDDDGLIEISTLAQLDAMRYDLYGIGKVDDDANRSRYESAFPNGRPAPETMGCPVTTSFIDNGRNITIRCTGYELVANLDFDTNGNGSADAGDAYWNDGAGWIPVGGARQEAIVTFDGNNHTIANLYINRPETDYVGLFASNRYVKEVGLVSVDIYGRHYVGGLAGSADYIANSYVTGSVSGAGDYVGGLAGRSTEFSGPNYIEDSYATSSVSGSGDYVGGLAGSFEGIINSYATGRVSGSGDYVGGLVGFSEGIILDSHATGRVSGSGDFVGGLVGFSEVSFWERPIPAADLSNHPTRGLAENSEGSISDSYAAGSVSSGGNYVGCLSGSFDGYFNIHFSYIINSYATGSVSGSGDFVGGLVGATVVPIHNSCATGSVSGSSGDYVGGLAGWASEISGSYATGSVSSSGDSIGGLVGAGYYRISGSYATGSVSGTNNVGGLVGMAEYYGISGSYAAGSVTGTNNVGGLVGMADTIRHGITAAYATGSVTGITNVGGLAGVANAITASYAVGRVTGPSVPSVGGLVGRIDDGGSTTNSYWDTQTTGQPHSAAGAPKTTAELQAPTGYTGIYAEWNVDADNADYDDDHNSGGDDPWDFGNSSQYTILKGVPNPAAQRR